MGLHASGDNGVKALVKSKYASSGRTYQSIGDLRKAIGVDRSKVTAALDGNVNMMLIPTSAGSFESYIGILTSIIKQAMGSAHIVVVAFDDPKFLTLAKQEEQAKRDGARKKVEPCFSSDLNPYPMTDSYTLAELTATTDCHQIVRCRAARGRFFDEVVRQVLLKLQHTISKWTEGGHKSVVIFDGIDPRGALRPLGAERETKIFGTHDEVAALFQREHDIGEGDIKLTWVEQRVMDLVEQGKLDASLHICSTIDSDAIALQLMAAARRNCAPVQSDVRGVLCMRERSQKRGADGDGAVFWALDYGHLLKLLVAEFWPSPPSPVSQREGIAIMVSGWVLSGCDFCKLGGGLNSRLVNESMPGFLATAGHLCPLAQGAWSNERSAAMAMVPAIRRLVALCAGNYSDQPRARKASIEKMLNCDKNTLLRAAWVVAYWSDKEHVDDLLEFGFGLREQQKSTIKSNGASQATFSGDLFEHFRFERASV